MKRYRSLYCILAVGLCSALSFGLSGSGTAEDPCLIQSLDDFDEFRNDSAFWDKHIRLEAELDFTSRIYYSALIESFEGVFDGNHQPIRNLRIDGGLREYVGFFGSCYSAEIRNMNFITPNVSAYKQVAVTLRIFRIIDHSRLYHYRYDSVRPSICRRNHRQRLRINGYFLRSFRRGYRV